MKIYYFAIIAFILIIAVFVMLQFFSEPNEDRKSQTPMSPNDSASITQISDLETQTNSEGAVEIAVAPKNFSDKEFWTIFSISETETDSAPFISIFSTRKNEEKIKKYFRL